jgi:hypothetical protein
MRLLRLLVAFIELERQWWELYEMVREKAGLSKSRS